MGKGKGKGDGDFGGLGAENVGSTRPLFFVLFLLLCWDVLAMKTKKGETAQAYFRSR